MTLSRTPLRRGDAPKRTGRIKPKKRSASEYARIYGSVERVEFVICHGCCVCTMPFAANHHIENGGAGRKASYTKIVPLCPTHHEELHRIGKRSFQDTHYINLAETAAEIEAAWLASQPPTENPE